MKRLYETMNEQIRPAPELRMQVMSKITPRRRWYVRLAAVTAMLAVILLATPVMAAYIPPINDLMYQVSPEMAEQFTPVQKSYVNNGIKMEVVSISVYGNTAELVVAFEDLEGDRITADFWPEFEVRDYDLTKSLTSSRGVYGLSEDHSGFDPETGVRTFLLKQNYLDYTVEELLGNKITLIADYGSRMLEPEEYDIPLELTDAEVTTVRPDRNYPTDHAVEVPFDGFGYGAASGYEFWNAKEEYSIITPGEAVYTVTEELDITGIAFIDGQLHVQSRSNSHWTSCEVWLVDKEGNGQYAKCYNFLQIQEGEYKGYYKEDVFDISEEELENYTLQVVVNSYDRIEGPWVVTFEFTESDYVGDDANIGITAPITE